MPNTRENLIKLIDPVLRNLPWGEVSSQTAGDIADHLIANGVTVQGWIPVTERLPEKFVDVLVFRNGNISRDYHEEDGWFAHDFQGRRATHWMPLPEPPKEG